MSKLWFQCDKMQLMRAFFFSGHKPLDYVEGFLYFSPLTPRPSLSVCPQTRSSQEVRVTMSQAKPLFQVCRAPLVLPPFCHRRIVPLRGAAAFSILLGNAVTGRRERRSTSRGRGPTCRGMSRCQVCRNASTCS